MTIAFEEFEGSPTWSLGTGGFRGRRLFVVADADAVALAKQLLGSYTRVGGQITFTEGIPFPGFPQALVTSVSAEPLDGEKIDGTATSLQNGTNRFPGGVLLSAEYQTHSNAQTEGSGEGWGGIIPGTLIDYGADVSSEVLTVPGSQWLWDSDDAPLKSDMNVGRMISIVNHTVRYQRHPDPPVTAIRDLAGKVNAFNVILPNLDIAPQGNLLFLGARISTQFEFGENATLYDLELVFAEKTTTASNSWNKLFREDDGWELIGAKIDGDPPTAGDGPYDNGDFDDLFTTEN